MQINDHRSCKLRSETVYVQLLAWGVTEADQEHAVRRAGQGQPRNAWDFVETGRVTGTTCPLDLNDKTIATGCDYHWAHAVYCAKVVR